MLNSVCTAQEPMPGYINSRKYVDDGRQKILEPHQRMLHKTLNSQVESRKVRAKSHSLYTIRYKLRRSIDELAQRPSYCRCGKRRRRLR